MEEPKKPNISKREMNKYNKLIKIQWELMEDPKTTREGLEWFGQMLIFQEQHII